MIWTHTKIKKIKIMSKEKKPTEGVLAEAHQGLRVIIPNKPSRRVHFNLADFKRIAKDAFRIKMAMRSPFPGRYPLAASISHCQIAEQDPLRFFVVNKWGNQKLKWYFGGMRTIINPEITWTGKASTRNREGCMSFPFQSLVSVKRSEIVEVDYYTLPRMFLRILKIPVGPAHKKLYLERAFLVQHEVDHMNNINIIDRWKHRN